MVTTGRDLRTGRSIWEGRRAVRVRHAPLRKDMTTDVLIAGAGITGAMIADALAEAGLAVTIVDRRDDPVKGSTVASTALVQYEIDTPLSMLSRKIGKADAMRAWRRSRLAVDAVAARLADLQLPDVVRRDSLYLAGNELDADGLAREQAARRAIGLPDRLLSRKELKTRFGISRAAALLGYDNLVIDPRKAAHALLASAVGNGARIFAPVSIDHLDCHSRSVTAHTDTGHTIRCRHLVLATGYEVPKSVPARGHKIISTYAIATVTQPKRLWPEQCMIWEASDPYLYLRTTPDGRIICGGEDEDFVDEDKRDKLLARKTRTLQRKLGKLIPGASTEIDFAWAGSFGQTDTGLPIIGEIPKMPNCFAALGYGGNGITYSRIAADVIAGMVAGRPDCDADLYRFS
ncbi:MAG: NAD(P)/FAD-dependent oxidoreductase [Pseudorhodoplanes sp.]|uniref:NAD(P)/FAD-dependent oxidoreductase n=1 Tax=Pseudorhodoplanes sp. TaxID=1934341 RepID=UPI003D11A253